MTRRVLVTGGAGFIGSHVAAAYLERGDRVWVVDDLSSGRKRNVPPEAEFVMTGIGDNALDRLFDDVGGFDIVNHHAAQIDVRKSVADPRSDARVNVDAMLNLLECCRRHDVGRVIFVSSGGVVYGEPEQRPTPETTPKMPLSPYGVTKLAAEYYLQYYHRVHGLEYAVLRYGNVYGPRQDPHGEAGVVAIFSNRIAAGEALTVYGDGEQTRDYIYVGDAVQANLLLSETSLPPAIASLDDRAYNVGTGYGATVNELAELLMDAAGRRVDVDRVAPRAGELRHSCLDASRLESLGWRPSVTLGEGLARTYGYIAKEEAVA